MSEEEIIEEVEKELKLAKNIDDVATTIRNEYIEGLLDLYNKEKEKNKELENADLTTVYMNGFYDGEKKWKDKINEKIADYTEKSQTPLVNSQSIREYTFGIRAFQKLLEERN